MATKKTSTVVATKAGKLLANPKAGAASKSVAGSAVSQAGTKKVTSKSEASTAAKVLKDSHSSASAKSAAGSVLAQRPAKKVGSNPGSGTSSGGPRRSKT